MFKRDALDRQTLQPADPSVVVPAVTTNAGPRACWPSAVVLVVLCHGADAQTTPAPTAATVLANVQHRYATTVQFAALFQHTVTDPATKTSRKEDGRLWAMSDGRFRWDYMRKRSRRSVAVRRSLIHDGQVLWDIDHDAKHVTHGTGTTNAAALTFFTNGSTFGASSTVSLTTTTTLGTKDDFVLELTPQSSTSATLYLVVASSNWRVRESVVLHPNGVTESFRFYQQDTSKTARASSFQVHLATMPTYTQPGATAPAQAAGAGPGPAPVTP